MTATRELYELISNLLSRGNMTAAKEILRRLFPNDFDIEMQIKGVRTIMAEPLSPDVKHEIQANNPEEDPKT
jgi:hypothetical protein